jgi:hypothetical protein
MKKRKLTQEERNKLASFLKNRPKTWQIKESYILAAAFGLLFSLIFSPSLFSQQLNFLLVIIGFFIGFLGLAVLGFTGQKFDQYLIKKDLKKNTAHLVTGPLKIEEIDAKKISQKAAGYWRSYYVGKVLLDKVYSKTEKSKYDIYKQGDILKVEHCPHSGHILKVTKETSTS